MPNVKFNESNTVQKPDSPYQLLNNALTPPPPNNVFFLFT